MQFYARYMAKGVAQSDAMEGTEAEEMYNLLRY
jgi:hypothetical protein